ncbi:transposase [Streptomyces ambofaciens ATCC 23877]|uniref:Transposase n=2 Tax=Streptomyces ambofaciens (strain ATCC 23877 / 3486 / DSM 40053 / JCM 4204 / NBRC 12836 / NRRL B-2516) TaxID=278992 RepID=A0A0K2AKV5_STRA7|nr:transposase [Streptomyces ambofaciens]AKZ53624.1 transposase [Streptomyces ambofaciens ATCC 23877]
MLSFPGLGIQITARVLAEIGDDRTRFADARGLHAYAGSSPVTCLRQEVRHHQTLGENDRLNHADCLWAFAALRHSRGAGTHYRRRREAGDWHAGAQRNLFNLMIGRLCHCPKQGRTYDELLAYGAPPAEAAVTAA